MQGVSILFSLHFSESSDSNNTQSHDQSPKEFYTFQLIFRCPSISWIHVGESLINVFEIF